MTLPHAGFGNGSQNLFPPDSWAHTKSMVSYLCQVIGFARDVVMGERIFGGNNNAILFTCIPLSENYDGKRISCVLRTGKRNWFTSWPPTDPDIKSTIALTQTIRKNFHLSVPATLAYDCTYENHIQSPYLIQERVFGETLEYEYLKLSRHLKIGHPRNAHVERRCKYATTVAGFVAALDKVTMPGYGLFKAHVNMPNKSTAIYGINCDFGMSRPEIDGHKMPIEVNFSKWVSSLLEAQMSRSHDIFLNLPLLEQRRIWELHQIGSQMRYKGLFTDQPAVLCHFDFFPRNIMVKSTKNDAILTGVIDWDDAKAFPRIVARKPPIFLWDIKESPLLPEEQMAIKAAFDEELERLNPGSGYMDDAYDKIKVMVRALCMYALFSPEFKYHHEMSFDELMKEWKKIWINLNLRGGEGFVVGI